MLNSNYSKGSRLSGVPFLLDSRVPAQQHRPSLTRHHLDVTVRGFALQLGDFPSDGGAHENLGDA